MGLSCWLGLTMSGISGKASSVSCRIYYNLFIYSFCPADLGEGVLGDGLEGLLHVDGLLGRSLEVGDFVLGVAPLLGALGRHRAVIKVHLGVRVVVVEVGEVAEGVDVVMEVAIDLVAEDDEGEVVGVPGTGLDQELVPPAG